MGIRIQPLEIDIPDDKPFQYDLLDRKEKAEVLTSLVSNIDGPCTMAIDAAWGAGKTTFLEMRGKFLRKKGFPVVKFNAWETDASGDPFVALTTEITEQLKAWPDSTVASRLHQTQFLAKSLLRKVAPGAIRAASGLLPGVGAELGHVLSSYASEAMAGYFNQKQSAAQFKASLQELANSLRASSDNKPTIVLIDELDRCRPTYAIELLETAKHIFGVDHVVFVLAVNRAELAHSVKALYGVEFGAEGYLRRFFDIDFRLPAPDRENFIRNTLTLTGVNEFLETYPEKFPYGEAGLITLATFLSNSRLTLRDIGQTLHRLAAVLLSLPKSEPVFFHSLTVLTVLDGLNPSLYRQLIDKNITANDFVDSFFQDPFLSEKRRSLGGLLVESVIIASEMSASDFGLNSDVEERKAKYPLYSHYADIRESAHSQGGHDTEEESHAGRICYSVAMFHPSDSNKSEPLGFEETVQRFELLSPDLKEATF